MNQAFTTVQAANHPNLGLMTLPDIDIDEATIRAGVAKFMRLRGLDGDSDPALIRAAEKDVREDAALLVMLNAPAKRFYDWFKRDDKSIYETSAVLGDDVEWAVSVLSRVMVLIEAEGGSLAS